MDWKEFLKPTKGKIMICISLFILGFLFLILTISFSTPACTPNDRARTSDGECPQPLLVSILFGTSMFFLPLLMLNIDLDILRNEVISSLLAKLVFIVLQLVYLYFISATIMFLVTKIKKK